MPDNIIKIPGYELSGYLGQTILQIRKQMLWFLLASFFVHMIPIITNLKIETRTEEAKRPPTTVKFIQRAPRLQKTMELQKKPQIVQRTMQRRVTQQRMSMMPRSMTTAATHGGTALGSLGRPGDFVDRTFSPQQQFYGPNIASDIIETRGGRRTKESLRDELIDYGNFSDRFYGLVIQGKDKKDIRGNLEFFQLQYRGTRVEYNGEPGWNVIPQALPRLVEYAEANTNLEIKLRGSIRLDDKELLNVPMIYMMGSEAAPIYTKEEVRNLENYLRNGGFIFIDDGYAYKPGAFNQMVRQMIEDALGYDAEFERIPNNHWLYHCWEDFSGPPSGEDDLRYEQELRPGWRPPPGNERYPYLEGIFLNGRLAVLMSNKGFCKAWGTWTTGPRPVDNVRQLQFGLNVIVFASTQKGGIVDRNWQKILSGEN